MSVTKVWRDKQCGFAISAECVTVTVFLVEMTYFIQLQVAIGLKYNRNSNTLSRNGKTTLFITSHFCNTHFFLPYDFPMFVTTHSI
jgi:hypothetical protein